MLGRDIGYILNLKKDDNSQNTAEIDTVAREVYDVSGAGDTASAVFSLALAVGANPREAAVLSNYAAGVVVAEVGTVAINPEQLKSAIDKHGA